ncbi:hypothetical protein FOL47_004298 [Perkinsus chesapeaki]|uniref:Uncharacterized protein n=1 Tax=Perkinsus chesapeaki TaxID=330153 RepID=A0A7J6M393_PERCH|nr:hypothetical protein FOL47_004298 [Perkinsus chesapeaki]
MLSSSALLFGFILASPRRWVIADHADDVVNMLNKRFNEGHPTDDLSTAGVLMHQWDNLGAEDYQQSWRPYTSEECTPVSAHANCQYADRISCLLINNEVRDPSNGRIPLFTYARGGTVEDPDFTQLRVKITRCHVSCAASTPEHRRLTVRNPGAGIVRILGFKCFYR